MYSVPYVIVFFILALLILPVTNSRKDVLNYDAIKFLILSFFVLVIIGMRTYLNTDWIEYKPVFDSLPVFGDSDFFVKFKENAYASCILYTLFGIISKSIYNSYFLFQFLCILFDYLLWIKILKNENIKNELFFMFFFFQFLFFGFALEVNLLRNVKAIVLFVYSIKYIKQRKIGKYMLLNLCGMLFHTSAMIFFPLYFVLNKKINKYFLFILFVLGSIIYLFKINWFMPFLRFMLNVLPLPKEFYIVSKLLDALWQKGLTSRFGSIFGYLERAVTFILFFIYRDKIIEKKDNNICYLNCLYFYVFIYFFCSEFSYIVVRVGNLFVFSYWFLYPQLYKLLKNNWKKIFLICFLGYGFFKIRSEYNSKLFLYESALSEKSQTYEQRREWSEKLIHGN